MQKLLNNFLYIIKYVFFYYTVNQFTLNKTII